VDWLVLSVMGSICGSFNGNCEVCCPLDCDAMRPVLAPRLHVPLNCW
jgi:hypothetical protein